MKKKIKLFHGEKNERRKKNVSSSRMGFGILTHNEKFILLSCSRMFEMIQWIDERFQIFAQLDVFLYRCSPPITLLIFEIHKIVTTSTQTRETTMKKSPSFLKQITS